METTTVTTSPTTHPVAEPQPAEADATTPEQAAASSTDSSAGTPAEAEQPADEDLSVWEKIELTADQLEDSLENLVHEGTARRITVKKDGEVIADFPLAVGVVGTLLAAPLAAVAAIVALIADCTIEVERERSSDEAAASSEQPAAESAEPSVGEQPAAEPSEEAVQDSPVETPAPAAAVTA